jgi:hypothetical protein
VPRFKLTRKNVRKVFDRLGLHFNASVKFNAPDEAILKHLPWSRIVNLGTSLSCADLNLAARSAVFLQRAAHFETHPPVLVPQSCPTTS